MKIYYLGSKEGYRDITLKDYDKDSYYIEMSECDYRIKDKWPRIELEIAHKGKKSDIPYFWASGGRLVLSENARNKMRDIFEEERIELLPMYLGEEVYYLVHIVEMEDIKLKVTMYGELKFTEEFNEEELIEKNTEDRCVFGIYRPSGKVDKYTYITEKFINRMKELGLKGINFKVYWDSEEKNDDVK